MTIGQALKEEQDDLGLTEEAMVRGIMSKSAYSRVINGKRNISSEMLAKILFKHDIDIDDFFSKIAETYAPESIKLGKRLSHEMAEAVNNHEKEKVRSSYEKIANAEVDGFLKKRARLAVAYFDDDLAQANVAYQEKTQLVQIINGFSSNLFSLVIYLVTGLLIQNKMVLFGTIIAIGNFHYYISGAIEDINFSLQKMKGSRGLNDTVTQECAIKFKNKKNRVTDAIGIQLHQLSYTYDKNKISFPDLKIDPGEKVLLTGINGRGKSTLLSLIAGDKPNFEGKIRFLTHDGLKSNFKDLQINYMRQKVKLFPGNNFLEQSTQRILIRPVLEGVLLHEKNT